MVGTAAVVVAVLAVPVGAAWATAAATSVSDLQRPPAVKSGPPRTVGGSTERVPGVLAQTPPAAGRSSDAPHGPVGLPDAQPHGAAAQRARTPENPLVNPHLADNGAWKWPVPGRAAVGRPFDPPDVPWGPGHRGVDLAAAVGSPVRAPAEGTVTFAGVVAAREVLVITHPGGLRSTLEPVTPAVPVGAGVAAGSVVGALAATPGHCSPTACLHWGVLRGTVYLDPLRLLRAPVVLLPLS